MQSLRGTTAIVGAADTRVGKVPDMGATELCVDAALLALADAGIGKDDVDGLVTCQSMAEPHMYHAEMIAEYLQIFPRYCVTANAGGGTTISVIRNAAAAIAAGICETVLISMADSLRSGLTREQAMAMQSSTGHPQFEIPYGPTVPAYYALIARAHMDRFGTTPEQLAAVAVSARNYALSRPGAQMTESISIDDVLESRMIADPLHLLDCSLVSDGGAAIVLTSAGRRGAIRSGSVRNGGIDASGYPRRANLRLLHAGSVDRTRRPGFLPQRRGRRIRRIRCVGRRRRIADEYQRWAVVLLPSR
jgi:acetyl-CoA acetyltransferase